MTEGSNQFSVRWIHELTVDGTVAFRAGRQGTRLVADWPGLATLSCARDGGRVTFEPVAGASRAAVGKLRGGQVRALLRDLAGELALHASAVAVDGRGVLFLGSDGAGKSTAATEMCFAHRAQLFADDVALLEVASTTVNLVPSEEHHWLTPESRLALGIECPRVESNAEKHRIRAFNIARKTCPLALVIALRFDPSVAATSLQPLRGVDAARLLLEASIRFDVEDGSARRREFEQLTTVYNSVPFLRLERPSFAPDGVAEFVLDALRRGRR